MVTCKNETLSIPEFPETTAFTFSLGRRMLRSYLQTKVIPKTTAKLLSLQIEEALQYLCELTVEKQEQKCEMPDGSEYCSIICSCCIGPYVTKYEINKSWNSIIEVVCKQKWLGGVDEFMSNIADMLWKQYGLKFMEEENGQKKTQNQWG